MYPRTTQRNYSVHKFKCLLEQPCQRVWQGAKFISYAWTPERFKLSNTPSGIQLAGVQNTTNRKLLESDTLVDGRVSSSSIRTGVAGSPRTYVRVATFQDVYTNADNSVQQQLHAVRKIF